MRLFGDFLNWLAEMNALTDLMVYGNSFLIKTKRKKYNPLYWILGEDKVERLDPRYVMSDRRKPNNQEEYMSKINASEEAQKEIGLLKAEIRRLEQLHLGPTTALAEENKGLLEENQKLVEANGALDMEVASLKDQVTALTAEVEALKSNNPLA